MNQNKLSSRFLPLAKAVLSAAILPILFIYIMIAKPDYAIMNALAHVVVPVAQWVGDVVTWPIRAVANTVDGVAEISSLRDENRELRAKLDAATANQVACEIAIKDNQKLNHELGMIQTQSRDAIVADIIHDNGALGHKTFLVNRGRADDIEPGMVVVSTDMMLVGIVIDVAENFARVRALTDADTNIAVRFVGTDVYAIMTGNGSNWPTIGFPSRPDFTPAPGTRIVTSNISGVLPAGIPVGKTTDNNDADVTNVSGVTRVIILKFDTPKNEYK